MPEYLLLTDLQNKILKAMWYYQKEYSTEYLANKLNKSKRGIALSARGIPPHLIEKTKNGYMKPIFWTCYQLG